MFYGVAILSIVVAGAVVLIPGAPLVAVTLAVNVIATLLMAPAIVFVLVLVNDQEIMGSQANSRWMNLAGFR